MTSRPALPDACPFCAPPDSRVILRTALSFVLRDAFPVTAGHALIIPHRHVATWAEASEEERLDLFGLIDTVCATVHGELAADGFNIGMNHGAAAGQTVPHLHLHVIPRRHGDVADPRGGVRHVIPGKGNYLVVSDAGTVPHQDHYPHRAASADVVLFAEEPRQVESEAVLATGGDDPFLPLLEADLATASQVDIAVAFVLPSGVERIEPHFRDLLERGGTLNLLTGDYFAVSDPDALERLLDLQALHGAECCRLRVYETAGSSFHPKAYLLSRGAGSGIAWIGSSNLSAAALTDGIEWNYRISANRDVAGWQRTEQAFRKLFEAPATRPLDHDWLKGYRARRPRLLVSLATTPGAAPIDQVLDQPIELPAPPPSPNTIQVEALAALASSRQAGYHAGLVVMATGLGKTWLAAFDTKAFQARRILFVAHREEILGQAMATFRHVFPEAAIGVYNGKGREADADILFASIQTLGRARHLRDFSPKAFDYIVVDEFHHASAATYTRLINHFEPAFLLGLTATPERSDGGDLMTLCQENLVYRCGVPQGIREGLLSAYHYFGVPDLVDYANIPWRSTRFDEAALTQAVATQARAENVFEQWQKRGGQRTLAFCVSQRHAAFMRGYFAERGVPCAAVHAGVGSDPRAITLEKLRNGELKIVFAVDMFNEGVDVPAIDTVMMLRPTESPIVWLQQFGRGLRGHGDKILAVIDYIGNHRSFLVKARTLLECSEPGDAALSMALMRAVDGEHELPPGCEITYELETVDIMRALLRTDVGEADVLRRYYRDFRERTGRRPMAAEAFHDGYRPRSARPVHGSWLGFVVAMGDLDEATWAALGKVRVFLDALETTRMTRAYKMTLLLAMLNLDALPGDGVDVERLAEEFAKLAGRSPRLEDELKGAAGGGVPALIELLVRNPIAAWTGERAVDGGAVFRYEGRRFSFLPEVAGDFRELFQGLVRELAEWRLAEYLDPKGNADGERDFRLNLSQSNGRPILFLPGGTARDALPKGWTAVTVNGKAYEANFMKIAVNVMREPGRTENVLPGVLRGWFGPDAGQPGTRHQVTCREIAERWELSPVGARSENGPELNRQYSREQIPALFGETFAQATWNVGFVVVTPNQPRHLILMVTLEKVGMDEKFQYGDRFLSPNEFQWQSQNRTTQNGKHGRLIRDHEKLGIEVHLFERSKKRGRAGTAAGFHYRGPVVFEGWEGEAPITVRWHLVHAVRSVQVD